ncbi:MAG: hypothetical protein AAFN92_07075 [Bacteroidota bacterium]
MSTKFSLFSPERAPLASALTYRSGTLPTLLLLILLCTCGPALLTAQQQAQVYTGNEAPLCFDTNLYRSRQIESYPILQFLGARCVEVAKFTTTKGLFRYKDAHQHYPEYQRLPLDIYFQPQDASREEIYHINTGSAMLHITLPMRYEGTYYVVIRDQVKPSVLIVNSVTLEAEFRRCCALTESIIPNYLH